MPICISIGMKIGPKIKYFVVTLAIIRLIRAIRRRNAIAIIQAGSGSVFSHWPPLMAITFPMLLLSNIFRNCAIIIAFTINGANGFTPSYRKLAASPAFFIWPVAFP